jgi:hypothetical protein
MPTKDYYDRLLGDAKSFYFSTGAISCPALNGKRVYFNRRGFQHLIRKGRMYRSLFEITRRCKLIPLAVQTVKTAEKIFYQETIFSEKTNATFWTLKKTYVSPNVTVFVIIRKLNDGKIHFFSVYDE